MDEHVSRARDAAHDGRGGNSPADNFDIPLPDGNLEFGFDRAGWSPPKAIMLSPRPNSLPDYWHWTNSTKTDRARRSRVSIEAFSTALAQLSLLPADVMRLSGSDSARERSVRYSWPRDLRWLDLPILGSPCYALDNFSPAGRLGALPRNNGLMYNSPAMREEISACAAADVAILDHPDPDAETLADFGRFLVRSGKPATGRLLLHFDGNHLSPLDSASIAEAMHAWEAHDRFVWNHVLNGWVILGRGLAHVLGETASAGRQLDYILDQALGNGYFHEETWSPVTFQMLFHIARNGGNAPVAGDRHLESDDYDNRITREASVAQASGLFENRGEGRQRWVWKGTGAYPTQTGPDLAIDESIKFDPLAEDFRLTRPGATRRLGNEKYCLGCLRHVGLVAEGSHGRLVLTEEGKRFADLIGPEMDDPDVLLRWRKPDGRFGGPEDVPSMDRWLNRAFRSAKRRVSGLPRALPKNTGTIWNREGTAPANSHPGHRKIIQMMGRMLQFKAADLTREGFPTDEVLALMTEAKDTGKCRGGRVLVQTDTEYGLVTICAGVPYPSGDIEHSERAGLISRVDEAVSALPPGIAAWKGTHPMGMCPIML